MTETNKHDIPLLTKGQKDAREQRANDAVEVIPLVRERFMVSKRIGELRTQVEL